MNRKIKVAAICGSLRDKSYNKMALKYIMDGAMEAGAEVVNLDLKKYDLPVYDHDIESAGEPESVTEFRNKLKNSDAVIICTPEYNHSIPGSLKNAIDWASRQNVHPFRGKYIALAGVTTGGGGTIRSQMHMLSVMRTLGGIVLTTQVHISFAAKVFDENGKITDEATVQKLINLGKEVVELTGKNF
jgi:chromate reductase, NAD(P)H dehydrogenase (quinone)